MTKKSSFMRLAVQIAAFLLLLAGALLCIFDRHNQVAPFLFTVGSIGMVALAVAGIWKNKHAAFRETRLLRLNLLASLALVVGAYLMFQASNSWVICLLVYALVTLFLSFRFK